MLFIQTAWAPSLQFNLGWTHDGLRTYQYNVYVFNADGYPIYVQSQLAPASQTTITITRFGYYTFTLTAENAIGVESDYAVPLTIQAARRGVREIH